VKTNNTIDFIINQKFTNQTIQSFLEFHHLSKSHIYRLNLDKRIWINDRIAHLNEPLYFHDQLSFDFTGFKPSEVVPFAGDIHVIYEDQDILALDKPTCLLVHTDGITTDTLTNRVKHYTSQNGYTLDALPVHRIDYETSGIVLFAKHPLSQAYLSNAFEMHQVQKMYICLVEGKCKIPHQIIQTGIAKDRHSNKQMTSSKGQKAYTEYWVKEYNLNTTRLEVKIKTGRKHQIRVHLQSIGHPIIGDTLYSQIPAKRLMLHFSQIEFIHPYTKEKCIIKSKPSF
jgi:23S rRNA pseudouridine1911/1915/1917 synthase